MTHGNPSRGSRRPLTSDHLEGSSDLGRAAPRIVIEIDLESRARVRIDAETAEDELRLRDWLRCALERRRSLSSEIVRFLDYLDERQAA